MKHDKLPRDNRFLLTEDVCARFGISRFTLRRWADDEALGFPKPTLIKRRHFYREIEIFRWEMKQAGYDPDMPPTLSGLAPVSGVITDYEQFVEAMTKRRQALGISCNELDALSGMQEAYANKLENHDRPGYGRGIGKEIFPLWIGGLRVGIVLVDLPRRPRRLKSQVAAAGNIDFDTIA